MNQPTIFRNGLTGSLLDVYQQAIAGLTVTTTFLPTEAFTNPQSFRYDHKTTLHYILTQAIVSGYDCADMIRKALQLPTRPISTTTIHSADDACFQLHRMLAYTEEALRDTFHFRHERIQEIIITTNAGTPYDLEQLLEHTIVQTLRYHLQLSQYLSRLSPSAKIA